MSSLAMAVQAIGDRMCDSIKAQMQSRAVRVANEMRNAELKVLGQGGGGGRSYRVPGTRVYYTASAPGGVPGIRTGNFRRSWNPSAVMSGDVAISRLETELTVGKKGWNLGMLLEEGTSKMAPRPHQEKILQEAKPQALAIYNEPYL